MEHLSLRGISIPNKLKPPPRSKKSILGLEPMIFLSNRYVCQSVPQARFVIAPGTKPCCIPPFKRKQKIKHIICTLYAKNSTNTADGANPYLGWDIQNPVNNKINYLSTGAGCLPSTVSHPKKKV